DERRLILSTTTGLEYLPHDVARKKLNALVDAARAAKGQSGAGRRDQRQDDALGRSHPARAGRSSAHRRVPHVMWRARIPELDGIRGLAIVLVVLHNASMKYPSLYPVFANGWMGVDLFFVLSGFLITGILLDTKHTEGYFTT